MIESDLVWCNYNPGLQGYIPRNSDDIINAADILE